MRKLVVALILTLLASPAFAQDAQTILASTDYGTPDNLAGRIVFIHSLKNYPRQMQLPKQCYSACTFALGLRQSCVTPGNVLYFHGVNDGLTGEYDAKATWEMMVYKQDPNQFMPYDLYPKLKKYLLSNGFIFRLWPMTPIDGNTLHYRFGVPFCGPNAAMDR